jgi:hypothetical protein
MIATGDRPRVIALLADLDPVLAELGTDLVALAITASRVRRALALVPNELSAVARAVETIHTGGRRAVDNAIAHLDETQISTFLSDLSSFVDAPLAAAVDDALAKYGVAPSPRLAAVLAISEPARCAGMLARLKDADEMYDLVPALSAAHLARLDRNLAVPRAFTEMWTEIDRDKPPSDCEAAVYEARLKLEARRDPIAAIASLRDAVLQVGGTYLGAGLTAVVTRAATVDRATAWALTRDLRWATARALALEGLAWIEPRAVEIEPTLRGLLDEWRAGGPNIDKSPTGAFQLAMPLLAASAHARRADLGHAVIKVLGPSPFEIKMATGHETRRANLEDGAWRPETWDGWVDPRPDGAAAAMPAAAALPELDDVALAAWWKLDTLPLRELPWYRPEDDRLP